MTFHMELIVKKLYVMVFLAGFVSTVSGRAFIDSDVISSLSNSILNAEKQQTDSGAISLIIFLNSPDKVAAFLEDINKIPGVDALPLHFMPAVSVVISKDQDILEQLAEHHAAAQISLNKTGFEEMEVSAQAIKLMPSPAYPQVNNWWDHGYTGKQGVIGLIDSGVAIEHPGLSNKTIILRKEKGSGFSKLKNGVRSAHGTGVSCIYTGGVASSVFPRDQGIAYGASTIVAGLAGEGTGLIPDTLLALQTLDWMLTRAGIKPTIINYSFGNGPVSCPSCTDWSGLAKIVDYVVNQEKILWVKSAGNAGYIEPKNEIPFASTMTVPADNYNALTVANMNPAVVQDGVLQPTPNRSQHAIRYTSSRGPTLNGRRKPDIAAPGNDTRTCAPDPGQYKFNYSPAMNYQDGYRLMGGTSSAAPHVGAAVLLLQDAGIKNPAAAKALLINSADTWTDSGQSGPDDPFHTYAGGHYPVEGSQWNRTYGWGYLNMQKAFYQRNFIIEDELSLENPVKEYRIVLPVGKKITLVHERRVGYFEDNREWKLSHLSLQLIDEESGQVIMQDDSPIDTVHQVTNCNYIDKMHCADKTKKIRAIVRVKLLSPKIDGSNEEPFALALPVEVMRTAYA